MGFVLANWRTISAVLGLVALFGGAGLYVEKVKHDAYSAGHTAGVSEATAKCEADKRAMEEANKKAVDAAQQVADDLAKQLQVKEGELDDRVSKIDQAADAGPGALDECLDADSVRRIGAIE